MIRNMLLIIIIIEIKIINVPEKLSMNNTVAKMSFLFYKYTLTE